MVVLITAYLLLVFMVPILVSAVVGYRSLPRTTACPVCAGETALLKPRGGQLARLFFHLAGVARRWCLQCGWTGLARRGAAPRTLTAPAAEPAPVPLQVLDVRSLRVDGRTWRVRLECWRDTHLHHGRLVFVDGTGRPWPDGLQAFSARTQLEVLGQALSIPDRTLASRLRHLITAD